MHVDARAKRESLRIPRRDLKYQLGFIHASRWLESMFERGLGIYVSRIACAASNDCQQDCRHSSATRGSSSAARLSASRRPTRPSSACRGPGPVQDGSLTDLAVVVGTLVNAQSVNEAFAAAAAEGPLADLLRYSTDPIVSRDFVGDPASCVFDAPLT